MLERCNLIFHPRFIRIYLFIYGVIIITGYIYLYMELLLLHYRTFI